MKQLYCIRNITRFKKCFMDLYSRTQYSNINLDKNNPLYMHQLGEKYDKLVELMQNKTVIKIFTAISNILYTKPNRECIKLEGKELLMIFAFYGFPEFTLDYHKDTLNNTHKICTIQEKLYVTTKKILHIWIQILNQTNQIKNLNKLIDYLNLFSYYFKVHMNNDRVYKINQLFIKWYNKETEKEKTINDDSIDGNKKKVITELLTKKQHNTIVHIKKFYKDFNTASLIEYKKLLDNIEKTVHNAFWDKIEEEFNMGNYESFISVLNEIRTDILKLVSRDIHNEIIENFDTEFIHQMLNNNAYSQQDFINLCNYLINVIESIQAPVRTSIMKAQWDELLNREHSNMKDSISYIKFIFNELDIIKESLATIKILDTIGINPFTI